MISRYSPTYRYAALMLTGILLAGGGFVAYRVLAGPGTPSEDAFKACEEKYAQCVEAMNAKDTSRALALFNEAEGLSRTAVEKADQQARLSKGVETTKRIEQRAQAQWLRVRVLRDQAFTKAAAEGKPIPELPDSITRESYRSVAQIPDDNARAEAQNALRASAAVLRDPAVIQEALRYELMLLNTDWSYVEQFSRTMITLNPADVRARYFLALLEFEQRERGTGAPLPPEKKKTIGILNAREHLTKLKETPYFPLWRTQHLDAQITRWLSQLTPDKQASYKINGEEESRRLYNLLFDRTEGALPRAERSEQFKLLSKYDINGIINLHQMALELQIESMRKLKDSGFSSQDIIDVFRQTNAVADKLERNPDAVSFRTDCLEAAVSAANKTRLALGAEAPAAWLEVLEQVKMLAQKLIDTKLPNRKAFAELARLIQTESYLEGKRGNKAQEDKLHAEALKWIDQGLAIAEEKKLPLADRIDLHLAALEIKTAQDREGIRTIIAPNIAALREIHTGRAMSYIGFYEAVIAQHEGKLDKSIKELEALLQKPDIEELRIRTQMMLSNLYLATNRSANAVQTLNLLEKDYRYFDTLSATEKAWATEFMRSPQELASMQLTAQLDLAMQTLLRLRADNIRMPPAKLNELLTNKQLEYNGAIRSLLEKLKPVPSPLDLKARLELLRYYIRLGNKTAVTQMLMDLDKSYPNNVPVLRERVSFAMSPANFTTADGSPMQANALFEAMAKQRATVDAYIASFLNNNKSDMDARRFQVEWLMRTGRVDAAIAYMADATNFPGERSDLDKRLLAVALMLKGDREQGRKLIETLPRDAAVELVMVQTTSDPEARKQLLSEAIKRFDRNGRLRITEAGGLYREGKFEEAATAFFRTREFAQVSAAARSGMARSLERLANKEPSKARELAIRLSKEAPDEPGPYLAAAYAALLLDDAGQLSDNWETSQTMSAALNRWQAILKDLGADISFTSLVRAEFWMKANREDIARGEAMRALTASTQRSDTALSFLVRLMPQFPTQDQLQDAGNYLNRLKLITPNAPMLGVLEANYLYVSGKTDEAVRKLESVVSLDPKNAAAHAMLVAELNALNRPADAEKALERWLTNIPDSPVAKTEQIRRALVSGKGDEAAKIAQAFVDRAMEQTKKNIESVPVPKEADVAKAWQERREAIQKETAIASILGVAQAYADANDPVQADAWAVRANAIVPDIETVVIFRAEMAAARKDFATARKLYEEILTRNKTSVIVMNNLADLLARHLNEPAEALRWVRLARAGAYSGRPIPVENLPTEFVDTLGFVYSVAARKKVEPDLYVEMHQLFQKAVIRFPHDPRMVMYLGEALAGMDRPTDARVMFVKAMQMNSDLRVPLSPVQKKALAEALKDALARLPAES